jgi:beta-glucanase (GH16 family)
VLPDGATFADAYHIFAVDWKPQRIDWLLDGKIFHTQTPETFPEGTKWVFERGPFFLLLNLAVDGLWPGYPDDTTQFPPGIPHRLHPRVFARLTRERTRRGGIFNR